MAVTAQVNVKIDSSQAEKTVGQLNETLSNSAKSANSLKAELRQTIQELQNLQPGTARFQELSARAGELRDQIADTNAVVNQLAGNVAERLFKGITGVVQVGVAGFQALQAGVALFGNESEEVQKTMVRLNALLNLSQALETFAGLDQKIVEIRASFQSLTTATVAQTVATEGEAIATTSAAVATTALGTAMKALPIIALIASIGTLVYGLYQYATATDEADKNEKKRKANLEALKKAEKEQTETIAKESSEFVGLIVQLKATNAGTKERETLIKQINSTYGTTLKNLSDEAAFQKQLNLEIANYITYQKAKFQLQKNEELVQKNLEKQATLQKELTLAQSRLTAEEEKARNFRQDDKTAGQVLLNIQDYTKEVNRLEGELKAANKRLEAYGKVNLDVNKTIEEVTNSGKKYVDQTKTSTSTTDKDTEALEKRKKALEDLNSILDRNDAAYEKASEIYQRLQLELESLDKGYMQLNQTTGESEFVSANESIEYLTKRFEAEKQFYDDVKELVKGATATELTALEERFVQGKMTQEEFIKERENITKKGIEKLTLEEKNLVNALQIELDRQLENIDANYKSRNQIAITNTEILNNEIERITLEAQKELDIKGIEQSAISEEEKAEQILQIKREYLDLETKNILDNAKLQVQLLEQQRDEQLRTFEGSTQERVQIETDYNNKIVKVNQDAQSQIQGLIEETSDVQQTQLDKLQESLDTIDDYLAAVQSLFADFESALTNLTEQQNQVRLQSYEDYLNNQTAFLDSQLQQRLITEEEYKERVFQLDQEKKQKDAEIAKDTFQRNRRLNLVGATIDGARAVLSTFANTPGALIVKSIAAALAGAFAATQIAVIYKSSFQAATGGIVPGMGSGEIDSVPATLAPGEAVINKKSTDQFLPVLDAINQANGGRSLMPNLPATNQGQKFEVVFPDNKQQEPVRAYVVESDISDAQKRVNRIENSTRF